ncbi:MAG: peptidoglycan-binding protein [Burkholderiales bacterium]
MKIAAAKVPVYSSDGSKLIGQLECGQDAIVLSETDAGTVIAYILGLVKKQDAGALVDAEEWDRTAGEIDRFLAYAASRVGCLYVSGGQGQAMTPELIRKLEKDDSNYRRALASYNRHASSGASVLGYDCSGLVVAYLLGNKLIDRDLTANGIYYTICDPISEADIRAGDLVFKKYLTSSKIYHCGVYMGDGSVVHAKGRDYGVVRETLSAAGWNRYGRLKIFAGGRSVPTLSRQLKRTSPTMRGDDVREVQQALVAKGFDPKGVDGLYGPNTQKAVIAFQKAAGIKVDGIVGPETWGKLME